MVIVFFGADAGCGCSMLSCSVANHIAEEGMKKVLLVSLSGHLGNEYCNIPAEYGLDDLHVKLKSNVLTAEELESMCSVKKNLYILHGNRNLKQRKAYMPEEIETLLRVAEKTFDYIIADAGSSLDLGTGIGALKYGNKNILVTTQSKKASNRYMQKKGLLKKLDIEFNAMIANCFTSKHFLPAEKNLKEQYESENFFLVEYSDYGMQAEQDEICLDSLDKAYKQQVADIVTELLDMEIKGKGKKRFWRW